MKGLGKVTREFIVEEKYVIDILTAINRHRKLCAYRIGNCGWTDMPTKWFISFDVSERTYAKIVKDLRTIGNFNLEVNPGGVVNLTYEMA